MTQLVKSMEELNHRILGRQFKDMRERLGISQTTLAQQLGIASYNTIANYESGKTSIPVLMWVRLEWLLKNHER